MWKAGGAIALLALITLYLANSAGFEAARTSVNAMPQIEKLVGQTRNVYVLPLPFRERFVGSDRYSSLTLLITGERRKAIIRIRMHRHDGQWRVDWWSPVTSW